MKKSSKLQHPSSREAPSAKPQFKGVRERSVWNLKFGVSLELGAWSLGFLLCVNFNTKAADLTPPQLQFFETKIRPLLVNNCYKCHSSQAEKVKGRLLLASRDGVLRGGESGPAIV